METRERESDQQQNDENKPVNHQATKPFSQRTTPQDLDDIEYHKDPDYRHEDKKELYEQKVTSAEKRTADAGEETDPEDSLQPSYVEASDVEQNGPHYDAKIAFDKEEGGQSIFDEENSRYEGQADNEDGSPPYYEEQGVANDEQLRVYNENLESHEQWVKADEDEIEKEQTESNEGVAEPYKENTEEEEARSEEPGDELDGSSPSTGEHPGYDDTPQPFGDEMPSYVELSQPYGEQTPEFDERPQPFGDGTEAYIDQTQPYTDAFPYIGTASETSDIDDHDKKSNPYTLITGATSGIGYELARIAARNGHDLLIVARNQDELDSTIYSLKSEFGHEVVGVQKDLFDKNAAAEIYEFTKDNGIEVNLLINNAGQGQYGEFVHNNLDRELDIIQLNISSLVSLTKLFLRDMVDRGTGKILNVASIASKEPGPWNAVYHATKAFVHSFTEAVRAEVKDKGVSITSLLPGPTDTDFFAKADMLNSKALEGELANPAVVAADGYNALMEGTDMVISGFKNKWQVALNNFIPDEAVAEMVQKQQAPKEQNAEV